MKDGKKTVIKGVIFDLDGLLIDSEKHYRKVSYEMAESFGKTLNDKILAKQMGRSPLASLEIYRRELGIDTHSAEELMHMRNQMMLAEIIKELLPMPGAMELIRALHRKVKMAIATGSPKILMDEVADQLQFKGYFEHIQTSDEIINGKPDPEIYLKTINILNLEPAECIVLEDSSNGAMAGHRAGCFVIAVPNEHTRGQDFSFADMVVGGLGEAMAIINGLLRTK